MTSAYDVPNFVHVNMSGYLLVEQIMGPIVQIVIQAPNLARMFVEGYWSNLPDGPLENPRWRPCFQDVRHFHYSKLKKMHLTTRTKVLPLPLQPYTPVHCVDSWAKLADGARFAPKK